VTALRRPAVVANVALALLAVAAAAAALPRAPGTGVAAGSLRAGAAAGAMRIEDSRGGRAILRSRALAPGGSVAGAVTIRSHGAGGRLLLSVAHLDATPGAAAGSLAGALRLTIRELTQGSHRPVYSGRLAAMPRLHLGPLAAGARRRYRFVVRLPATLVGESAMGTRVSFDYRWRLKQA
jgi:hypothetical protein